MANPAFTAPRSPGSRVPACTSAVRRRGAVLAAGALCAVAVGACGSSTKPKRTAHTGQFLAFSQCMRAHGVTNFPDPSSGGGIRINIGSGINPLSPSFKAAQGTCRHLLPGGGPPTGPPSAAAMNAMLKVSQCMRAHGVTGFPDPTTTPPSSPVGYSLVQDFRGVVLAIPGTINVASPAFQSASKACDFGGGP